MTIQTEDHESLAIAQAGPLRDCLRGWFGSLEVVG